MTATPDADRQMLLRRGFALEWATLGWNVVGIIVLALAALAAPAKPASSGHCG